MARRSAQLEHDFSRWSSRARGSSVLPESAWGPVSRGLHLSPREVQIVRATFDDLKECAIAGDLGISAHTVHTHVERLHRKLGVADRAQLILRVIDVYLRMVRDPDEVLPPICRACSRNGCPLAL